MAQVSVSLSAPVVRLQAVPGVRAPPAHIPSTKLLTLPKTSLRGQMPEQGVAGACPWGS